MSSTPGFEDIEDDFLAEFGQPVKVRPTGDPAGERGPVLGVFRKGYSGVRAQDWENSDTAPMVAVSDDIAAGVIKNDGEVDISNLTVAGSGQLYSLAKRPQWVSGWTTYKVTDYRPDGIAMTILKLHLK